MSLQKGEIQRRAQTTLGEDEGRHWGEASISQRRPESAGTPTEAGAGGGHRPSLGASGRTNPANTQVWGFQPPGH